MDASRCFEILNRRHCSHADCTAMCGVIAPPALGEDGLAPLATSFEAATSDMTAVQLVDLFLALQSERVQVMGSRTLPAYHNTCSFGPMSDFFLFAHQTYAVFNSTLQWLVAEHRLPEYPPLCAEITSIFAIISKKIISIRVRTLFSYLGSPCSLNVPFPPTVGYGDC